jgi:hypothetical protein
MFSCHFVKLPSCKVAFLLRWLFIQLLFGQVKFLSICLFVKLRICQVVYLSSCLFVKFPLCQVAFFQLLFCQVIVLSGCHLVKLHSFQVDIFSFAFLFSCHFVKIAFLSKCLFVKLIFCTVAIFVKLPSCQVAFLSSCLFVNPTLSIQHCWSDNAQFFWQKIFKHWSLVPVFAQAPVLHPAGVLQEVAQVQAVSLVLLETGFKNFQSLCVCNQFEHFVGAMF